MPHPTTLRVEKLSNFTTIDALPLIGNSSGIRSCASEASLLDMRKLTAFFVALTALFGMAVAPAQAADDTRGLGIWRNPKDNVRVEIKRCGPSTCGVVVYASPKAQADARKSGYDTLIGQQLLRDFEPIGNGSMRGKVFVPTLKVTLSGTAEFVDTRTMRAKGCVLGRVLCKSQIWTRVDSVSARLDNTTASLP